MRRFQVTLDGVLYVDAVSVDHARQLAVQWAEAIEDGDLDRAERSVDRGNGRLHLLYKAVLPMYDLEEEYNGRAPTPSDYSVSSG